MDRVEARRLFSGPWWRRRVVTVVVLATLLVVTGGDTALARVLYLQTPRLGADLEYSFRNETQTTPNRTNQIRGHRFLEGLNLATRGYVYHPALFVFELEFEPTWEQQNETYTAGRDTARKSLFLDYGFSGTLFQERMLSLRLQTRRATSTTSTSLNPSSNSENVTYSASLRYRSRTLPSLLNYVHSERDQEGFNSSTQVGDKLTLNTSNKTERQRTTLKSEYDKQQRENRQFIQSWQSYRVDLSNNLNLTTDKRMVLTSALQSRWFEIQEQDGSNLSLNENLSWRHTDPNNRLQIRSDYSARYSSDRQGDERREDIPLEARFSLSHLLYENLTTSLDGNTGYRKYGDSEEKKYGASYNFSYNRRVPIGMVSLNHGQSYQVSDTSTLPGTIVVTRLNPELLRFDAFGARLANFDVDFNTIEIFDADGLNYAAVDYDIIAVGDFVEVRPIFGSSLYDDVYPLVGDPKQVLASYSYRADPSAKIGTHSSTFGAGLTLGSALTLRYQLTLLKDRLLDGTRDQKLADDTLQIFSAQLDYGWSKTQFTYDDEQRAAGNSSRRWQAQQFFLWRLRPDLNLSLGGNYSESELVDSGDRGQNYGFNASGQWQPKANQQVRFVMAHRISKTNRPNRNENSGLELGYLLRYGIWQLEAKYRYILDQQLTSGQERSENRFDLALRRPLF